MLRFAIGNLLSRPLRSALSMLGLAVAISGMVGLFSIAGGINQVVSKTFEQIPGLLVQQQGAPIPLFSSLPSEWEAEIAAIPGVGVVDPEVFCRVNQLDKQVVINPPRFAVGMEIEARLNLKRSIYRENLVEGRFFTKEDANTNRCFISREIAGSIEKGVGESVKVNGIPFEIIGIYDTGSLMLDVNLLMDIGTCRSLGRIDQQTVGCFYVEPDGTVETEDLKQKIKDHFRGRDLSSWQPLSLSRGFTGGSTNGNPLANFVRQFHSPPQTTTHQVETAAESQNQDTDQSQKDEDSVSSPVEVRSADDWGKRIAEFSQDLNIFLFLMTAIGVSIATLSIVNTMLMSVTERTTEFGILRANGWSRSEIVKLMTLESSLIGFLGGFVGVAIGWAATQVINWNWPGRLQLHADVTLLITSLLFSIVLGLIGGIYPAWRASQLSPMESIRRG